MKDLKKVLSHLKYDKKDMIISILLIIIECAFELVIPFVMKDIINNLPGAGGEVEKSRL